MKSKKILPAWYGGGIGNNRNAFDGVGHLSYAGFFIFPNRQNYDYKHSFERNRTEIEVLPEQFH